MPHRPHELRSPALTARLFFASSFSEEEFMAKLKAIEGTSLHETQEITFVRM
jgi:hypothetical protein